MDVVSSSYLPGDQGLVDKIVYELKSQGIFDHFRRECIADVDTKPAYQNLRQRVEGNVTGFLSTQSWNPDMNKNQVREQLRKNIYESGFLEIGVERIVDQVVNPKINSIFHPKVEEVVYKFLGLQRPNRTDYRKEPAKVTITDLLPTDLEAVSPESDILDDSDYIKECELSNNDSQDIDDGKGDEDESPPFEPLEGQTSNFNIQQEVFPMESQLSDVSGVLAHDSNSNDNKVTPMDVCSQDSQMSLNESESRLSIITDEITKMDVCDSSNMKSSLESGNGSEDQTSSDKISISTSEKGTQQVKKMEEPKNIESERHDKGKKTDDRKHDSQKHESKSSKHRSSSDKHKTKHEKDEKNKRSKDKEREKEREKEKEKDRERDKDKEREREKDRDKEKPSKHSLSRENSKEYRDSKSSKSEKERDSKGDKTGKDRNDKHKNEKDKNSGEKSDKNKIDKEKSQKSDKSDSQKSDRHKSDKSKHKLEREKSENDKTKSKDRSEKDKADKEKISKEKAEKDKERKEKSDKDKTDRSDKEKSDKYRLDKEKAQLDKQKSEKDRTEKLDREKSDKEKSDKMNKEKSGKEKVKSDKDKHEKNDKERKDKQSSSRHNSTSSHDKSSSRKEKDSSSKEKSKSNSKSGEKAQNDIKSKEAKDDHRNKSNSKKDEKHSSHKKTKDKKKDKDDHYSAKDRKHDRRSTDRDSNDGRSSKHVNSSSGGNQSHLHTHKSSQESTGSSHSGSGDSGNSEQLENTKIEDNMLDNLEISGMCTSPEKGTYSPTDTPTVKLIKPKFASNFQEARRLMKIRKQLSKLEKHNQLSLASVETPVHVVADSTQNAREITNIETPSNNGQFNRVELKLSPVKLMKKKPDSLRTYSNKNVSEKRSKESRNETNHKLVTDKLKAKLNIKTNAKAAPKVTDKIKSAANITAMSKPTVKVKWNHSKTKLKNVKGGAVYSPLGKAKKIPTKGKVDVMKNKNGQKMTLRKAAVEKNPHSPDQSDQIEEITPPLKNTVITVASWDALEAKLNQELLKVDYDSYECPDLDYSPVKTEEHVRPSVCTKVIDIEAPPLQLSSTNSNLHLEVGALALRYQDCSKADSGDPSNSNSEGLFEGDKKASDDHQSPDNFCKSEKTKLEAQGNVSSVDSIVDEDTRNKNQSDLLHGDKVTTTNDTVSHSKITSRSLVISLSKLSSSQEQKHTGGLSNIPVGNIPMDHNVESQMNEESDASKENIEPSKEDADITSEDLSNDQRTPEESSSNILIEEANNSDIGKIDDSIKNARDIEQMKKNLKCLIVNIESRVCPKEVHEKKLRNYGRSVGDNRNSSVDDIQLSGKHSSRRIKPKHNSFSCDKHSQAIGELQEKSEDENMSSAKIAVILKPEDRLNEPNQSTASASTILHTIGEDSDGDCRFLVQTDKPDTYLQLIRKRIGCLEKSMSEQQELITRLNYETKSLPQRGRKRKIPQENDVSNNNKRGHMSEDTTERIGRRSRSMAKTGNTQTHSADTTVNPSVSLAFSPPESVRSPNTVDNVPGTPSNRRRINKVVSQRYSSDDLYKPRTNFCNTRRAKDSSS